MKTITCRQIYTSPTTPSAPGVGSYDSKPDQAAAFWVSRVGPEHGRAHSFPRCPQWLLPHKGTTDQTAAIRPALPHGNLCSLALCRKSLLSPGLQPFHSKCGSRGSGTSVPSACSKGRKPGPSQTHWITACLFKRPHCEQHKY